MAKKRQQELAGLEKPSIKAVEEAADDYVEARDKRTEAAKTEKATAAALVAVLRSNRLKSYSYDGLIVRLDEIDKVSVKSAKDAEDSE